MMRPLQQATRFRRSMPLIRRILMQNPGEPQAQPHAHWMGHDGKTMATPNSNSNDSTFFNFITNLIFKKPATGPLPIAAAMNPNSTKYYVSNYLGHSISVIDMATGNKIKDINLLQNYNPITGAVGGNGAIGGLPIQTPVSPDGKFVITGNTLTGTITIIDAATDTLVKTDGYRSFPRVSVTSSRPNNGIRSALLSLLAHRVCSSCRDDGRLT